jgi:hypothetical protein
MKIAAEKLPHYRLSAPKHNGNVRGGSAPYNRESIAASRSTAIKPGKNHLPEAQIARRPVIGRYLRIALEERRPGNPTSVARTKFRGLVGDLPARH